MFIDGRQIDVDIYIRFLIFLYLLLCALNNAIYHTNYHIVHRKCSHPVYKLTLPCCIDPSLLFSIFRYFSFTLRIEYCSKLFVTYFTLQYSVDNGTILFFLMLVCIVGQRINFSPFYSLYLLFIILLLLMSKFSKQISWHMFKVEVR